MKQIQVIVKSHEVEEIVQSLSELVSPSQITHIKGDEAAILLISVMDKRTGFILNHLHELGIGRVRGRISIFSMEATIPQMRHRKQDKFLKRISIEELEQTIESLTKLDFNYIAMIILSSILAAMGLIFNDNITVIASMIIAPLLGPIVGIAFGAMASKKDILRESIIAEFSGIGLSIMIGFFVGLIFQTVQDSPTEFIQARGEPNIVSLLIAIASGLTAGIAFANGTALALVGVAAAAALLPVTVNIGIAVGMFEWAIALGSLILFITNFACIQLGCLLVFWIRKVEPPHIVKKVKAKRTRKTQIIAILILLAIVSLPIINASIRITLKWQFQIKTKNATEEVLSSCEEYIGTEAVDAVISSRFFQKYTVSIYVRVLATAPLPNNTAQQIETLIESRCNQNISSFQLEVVFAQIFERVDREVINKPIVTYQSLNSFRKARNTFRKKLVFKELPVSYALN
ncbi:MAG: TIGR00341 family protein [Asgard group archaeon]|nr:TIGR00341 family protein [Asgard group archaeon]